jgi:chemotaxis-related protein WspD
MNAELPVLERTDGSAPSTAAERDFPACWLEIGVYGKGDCPDLPKYVHCRNCPVYSDAGVRLLDRLLPEGYRREWTAHFAQEAKAAPPARTSAVVFRISAEWLALPTQAFQEVAERRRIQSLPHRRQGIVLGLVNIRGELLICISLGRLLGLEKRAAGETHRTVYERLLVVNWEGNRLVFPVDEVEGIYRFQARELKEPPATLAKFSLSHTQGLLLRQQRTVGVLNAASLFPALNRSLS